MDAPGIILPDRLNAAALLVDAHIEAGRGGRTAILCGGRTVTYAGLKDAADRFGGGLRMIWVRPEERVLILLPDGPELAAAFLGAMKVGAVSVPVSAILGPGDCRAVLEDSRAAVLVVAGDLLPSIRPALAGLPSLRHVIVAGGPAGGPAPLLPGTLDLEAFLRESPPAEEPAATGKDDVAFWLYSSGTTGRPKAAVHLHHDMIVAADLYGRGVLGLGPGDICFSAAKLPFAFGLGNGLYFPFRAGAAAVHLPGRATTEAVLAEISRHEPTVFFWVPSGFAALLSHAEARGISSLGRVRLAVSAGEHLPAGIFERFKARFGIEILDGIGSTEVLHIFISNTPGSARAGSTGRIVPGYAARIVDPAGNDVAPGEVGDLLVKGDSTMPFYWNRHEETKRTVLGAWIRTGDRFHADDEGWYWFHGRSDEMLKISGAWVSPVEVEAAILGHPAAAECAAAGFAGPDGLTRILASVVLRPGFEAARNLAEEIRESLRGRIAGYKIPHRIEFVAALPRTATGKVQRHKLREAAGIIR